MIDHADCEELCAIAASGHLVDVDREALALHCLQCCSCRDRLSELAFVGAQLLGHGGISFRMPEGGLERFRARAARDGIAMRQPTAGAWMSYVLCPALVMAMLIFVARSVVFPHTVPQVSMQSALPEVVVTEEHEPQEAVLRPAAFGATPKRRLHTLQTRSLAVRNASFPMAFALHYLPSAQRETTTPVFDSPYPTLSGFEMKRLDLFRSVKEPTQHEPFRMAAIEWPATASVMGCSFDFADNIRQLRFQIPNVH